MSNDIDILFPIQGKTYSRFYYLTVYYSTPSISRYIPAGYKNGINLPNTPDNAVILYNPRNAPVQTSAIKTDPVFSARQKQKQKKRSKPLVPYLF